MSLTLFLGLLLGAVLGLSGAGGGILAVPALVAGMGWSMQQAAPVALIAVAGSAGEGLPALARLATEWGGKPEATALPLGRKVPMPQAAFLNGLAGRAWDLDDVHEQNTCHINVNVVAPVMALAEATGTLDGPDRPRRLRDPRPAEAGGLVASAF